MAAEVRSARHEPTNQIVHRRIHQSDSTAERAGPVSISVKATHSTRFTSLVSQVAATPPSNFPPTANPSPKVQHSATTLALRNTQLNDSTHAIFFIMHPSVTLGMLTSSADIMSCKLLFVLESMKVGGPLGGAWLSSHAHMAQPSRTALPN